MDRKTILEILRASNFAPSGENSQPWLFKIYETQVDIFNDPTKDTSLYNYNQHSNLTSHGCLIENILITTSALGYGAELKISESGENDLVASIVFNEQNSEYHPDLYPYISKRCTNRKPYKKMRLTEKDKAQIFTTRNNANLGFIENLENIRKLSISGATNEKIVFENKELHSYLFKHMTWTKEQDSLDPGFYIKTLELPPPIEMLFKLFRSWSIVKYLNKIGFSEFIKFSNHSIYQKAAGMGVVTLSNLTKEAYIRAGMRFQRLWLVATKCNISIQPLTGVLYFMRTIESGGAKNFSEAHAKEIRRCYNITQDIFALPENNIPLIMFRIGYGDPPSGHTSRYPIDKFIINK